MVEGNALPVSDPSVVGPWRVESRIGAGGMGVVYRAVRGDRVAAVKVVRPGLLDDPATQARFTREVEVLSAIRDVHISEFLDADLTGEPAWLATAFVPGANLREAVATWGPLTESEWWQLARGLAQALAVLELHGITHRDIKPANVILAPHGPVLIDFGIALPADAASLTATGLVTGSASWLSPEQADLKPATAASDVFSLGALLTFAATGRPPFGQGAHVAVLAAIATKDPDLDGLTGMQANLVTSMLAKDPADRPTAREILAWVKRVQEATSHPLPAATPVIPAPEPLRAEPPHAEPLRAEPTPEAEPQPEPPTADQPRIAAVPPREASQPAQRSPLSVALWVALAVIVALVAFTGVRAALDGGADSSATGDTAVATAQPTPAASGGPSDAPTGSPSASTTAPPPAPAQDVLSAGDWDLTNYRITNDGGVLGVDGTVRNNGAAAASATLTVFVYVDGQFVGSASGQLDQVPAGGTAEVQFEGTDEWRPGEQTVLIEASAA